MRRQPCYFFQMCISTLVHYRAENNSRCYFSEGSSLCLGPHIEGLAGLWLWPYGKLVWDRHPCLSHSASQHPSHLSELFLCVVPATGKDSIRPVILN